MRKKLVVRMIDDASLEFASISSLAVIIAQYGLFKPSEGPPEGWGKAVHAAWNAVLRSRPGGENDADQLVKDVASHAVWGDLIRAAAATPRPERSSPPRPERPPTKKSEYTPEELKEIISLHRRWLLGETDGVFGDLSRVRLAGINFSNMNLSHMNFMFANLSGANLSGANLDGVNFMGTNLSGADLGGASLQMATLEGARLNSANLVGANLRIANLRDADLSGANLLRANLAGANLQRANLLGASLVKSQPWDFILSTGPRQEDARLENATYNRRTVFPDKFNPAKRGMILVQKQESRG